MSKKIVIILSFVIIACFAYDQRQILFDIIASKKDISSRVNIGRVPNKTASSNKHRELLKSLPYASWSEKTADSSLKGVVKFNSDKAFAGYNLYTDDRRYALLLDMSGKVVHKWKFPPIKGKWEYARLLEDGSIVALCVAKCFAKLDKNSEVVWLKRIPANHDIALLPDGTYMVPVYRPPVRYNGRKVRFDAIARISEAGEMTGMWSTYEHLDELLKLHGPRFLDKKGDKKTNSWKKRKGKKDVYEYYHLNTVEVLPDTPLGRKDGRFQKGNFLICLRNVSLIATIDKISGKIVWGWGPGELDWPHMPTMLDNGNILIFDNGVHRNYSRVIEIIPTTGRIVWEYRADPPEGFYSKWRGSNQRFPNGNTLICESENGRVFEITPDGEIVWEFYNPEVKNGKRRLIYRFLRVPREKVESWLKLPW